MLKKMKDEIELLSRHIAVAKAVADQEPIGIMKLAEQARSPFAPHPLLPACSGTTRVYPRITGRCSCDSPNG